MGKHSGSGGDPFSGSVGTEERAPVDNLLDRLFDCGDNAECAIAQLQIGAHFVEGLVNDIDRSGVNMVSIGFMVSRSVSIKWRGRKLQTRVEGAGEDVFLLYDEGDTLQVAFIPVGSNRCPANGDLWDPTD